jgi:hypothetical protein
LDDIIHIVDRSPSPALLPIFRSQQQAEILTLLFGDPSAEHSLAAIVETVHAPYSSVHREIERAEKAGLTTSRTVGRTRLVRANVESPYFAGLADILVRAFGAPALLGKALQGIDGIGAAYIHGSWAAQFLGAVANRPIGDIDLLILGEPDRDRVYGAISGTEERLGRPVQVTIRPAAWLRDGAGSFHDTVASRPLVPLTLLPTETAVAANSH